MEILDNFIVFEGLDGAGTTTQAKLLAKALLERSMNNFLTCEPTDHEIGRLIRKVLAGEVKITHKALAMLYAADRDDHIYGTDGIIEHLEKNDYVISDRYLFSSEAYQSINTPFEEVAELNSRFPMPQYLIYIDTPVDHCMQRIESSRTTKDIFEHSQFQQSVYENYDIALSNLSDKIMLIRLDGTLAIEEIQHEILRIILSE